MLYLLEIELNPFIINNDNISKIYDYNIYIF